VAQGTAARGNEGVLGNLIVRIGKRLLPSTLKGSLQLTLPSGKQILIGTGGEGFEDTPGVLYSRQAEEVVAGSKGSFRALIEMFRCELDGYAPAGAFVQLQPVTQRARVMHADVLDITAIAGLDGGAADRADLLAALLAQLAEGAQATLVAGAPGADALARPFGLALDQAVELVPLGRLALGAGGAIENVVTAGSVSNLEALQAGTTDCAFSYADVAYEASAGRLPDASRTFHRLRGVA
jgi:hypothetical protein